MSDKNPKVKLSQSIYVMNTPETDRAERYFTHGKYFVDCAVSASLETRLIAAERELAAIREAGKALPDLDEETWIIFFEDAEYRPEVFKGAGAMQGALHRYEQCRISWACHLLVGWPTVDALRLHALGMAKDAEGCICKGNWRQIIKECEGLFDKRFADNLGDEYTFFGLVHGGDDYYYGMSNKSGVRLLSCVGNLETHGFKLVNAALSERGEK